MAMSVVPPVIMLMLALLEVTLNTLETVRTHGGG